MTKRGVGYACGVLAVVAIFLARSFATNPSISLAPQTEASGQRAPDSLSLITEPEDGLAPILALIDSASSSVDVVMYEFEDPDIEQALAADASRGVAVRVLLNGGYYGKKENDDNDAAYAYLQQNGAQVHWTPARFALTHQKTLVVDGKVAAIMTMNFTPQYYASSRDLALIDTDAGDVSAIETTFDADWSDENIQSINGDGLVWSPGSEDALLSIINGAQTSLDVYNEEMADPAITHALENAAQRGVVVDVDMTYASNWKKAFAELSNAGVHVRTYAANAPLYIHAKIIIADDDTVFLGSENFSSGSLDKNRELGITFSDAAVIASLENIFKKDWADATVFNK